MLRSLSESLEPSSAQEPSQAVPNQVSRNFGQDLAVRLTILEHMQLKIISLPGMYAKYNIYFIHMNTVGSSSS